MGTYIMNKGYHIVSEKMSKDEIGLLYSGEQRFKRPRERLPHLSDSIMDWGSLSEWERELTEAILEQNDSAMAKLQAEKTEFNNIMQAKKVKFESMPSTPSKPPSALDVQIGGSHYKDKAIQPIEYIMANKLNYCEGAVIKYITRYKDKNGREDLEKIKHYIDLILENEYDGI